MVKGRNEEEQAFFDAFAEWYQEYGNFDVWAQECDEYRGTLQSGEVDASTMADLSQWANDVLEQLKSGNRALRKVFSLKSMRREKAGRTSDPRYLEENLKYLSSELNKLAGRDENPDNWGVDALEYSLTLLKDIIKAADSFESSKSRTRQELKIPKRLLKQTPPRARRKGKSDNRTAREAGRQALQALTYLEKVIDEIKDVRVADDTERLVELGKELIDAAKEVIRLGELTEEEFANGGNPDTDGYTRGVRY